MIHSARPIASSEYCFHCVLQDFEKWGRTVDMCENNDPTRSDCELAEWIKSKNLTL